VVIGLLRRGERRALVLPLLDGDVLLPALQAAERRVAPVKKKRRGRNPMIDWRTLDWRIN
jgi:hypothetical protein